MWKAALLSCRPRNCALCAAYKCIVKDFQNRYNKITLLSRTKATETQLGLVYFWKDDEGDWNISTINSYSSEDIPNATGITLNVTARKVKTQVNATGTTLILD